MKNGLLLICRKKEVAAQLMKKVDDNLLKLFKTVFKTPVKAGSATRSVRKIWSRRVSCSMSSGA